MTLLTYRVSQSDSQRRRLYLQHLYQELLKSDPKWHFFQDEGGITLRVSKSFGKKVEKLSGRTPIKKKEDYDPSMHEYPDLKFLGNDLIPLFHEISILSVKYPKTVMQSHVLERLAHAIVNQSGLFNFEGEAWIYVGMAIQRAILGGKSGRYTKEEE